MANLTIEHNIIKKRGDDFSPERGFDLVIFKNHKFDKIVPNGQKPAKNIFNRFSTYEVYAVNKVPHNLLNFRSSMLHNDNIHDFHIDYTLAYKVVDARKLVEHLESDPLKLLRRKVKQVLDSYISYAPWYQIEEMNEFRQLVEEALRDTAQVRNEGFRQSNFDLIFNFAMEYGIEVNDIGLKRKVVEKIIKVNVDKDMRLREHDVNLLQKDLDEELNVKDRVTKGRDHFSNAMNTAMKDVTQRISGGIESVEELKKALHESRDLPDLFQPSESRTTSPPGLQPPSSTLSALGPGVENSFSSVCYQILSHANQAGLPVETQRILLSSIFHLIAIELFRGEEDDHNIYVNRFTQLDVPDSLKGQIQEGFKQVKTCVQKNQLI